MDVGHVLEEGGAVTIALLKLVDATAGVFPPLKGATGVTLNIAEMVMVRLRRVLDSEALRNH